MFRVLTSFLGDTKSLSRDGTYCISLKRDIKKREREKKRKREREREKQFALAQFEKRERVNPFRSTRVYILVERAKNLVIPRGR